MKIHPTILAFAVLLGSLNVVPGAEPKAEVKDAIKKLGDQPNYSWVSTPKTEGSQSARRQGSISGATEKDGFTALAGLIGDTTVEIAAKGDKMAVNYEGDWLSTAEIGENNRAVQRLKALKNPVVEAEGLLAKVVNLKRESDGRYAGDMTPEAAKELFGQLGKRAAEAPEAKGVMSFQVKDGILNGYQYKVSGKITAGEDKREVDISRTVTVEIKDIGSTKVTLPEEAKKKVS